MSFLGGWGLEGDTVSLAAAPAGGAYLAADFEGAVTLGGQALRAEGSRDVLVAKLDDSGAPSWAWSFGGPGLDQPTDAATLADGALTLTGFFLEGTLHLGDEVLNATGGGADGFLARVDPGGGVLWARSWGARDAVLVPHALAALPAALDPEGGVALLGHLVGTVNLGAGVTATSAGAADDSDAYLARLDGQGEVKWVTLLSAPATVWPEDVAAGDDGTLYVAVHFGATLTVTPAAGPAPEPLEVAAGAHALLAFGPDGTWRWGLQLGDERPTALAVGASGDLFLAGHRDAGGWFAARYTPDGVERWTHRVDGSVSQRVWALGLSAGDALTVSGEYQGHMDVGGDAGSVDSGAYQELFVTRLGAQGGPGWVLRVPGCHRSTGRSAAWIPGASAVWVGGVFQGDLTGAPLSPGLAHAATMVLEVPQ